MAEQTRPASNWNIPNALTALRILMVPFFIWALWAGGPQGQTDMGLRWLAALLFVLAMLTDWLDGYLARKNNLITSFGKIADPIADKLLTGSAFVLLSLLGELWWWVTLLILAREWGITLLRFFIIKYGVMAASKGGKLKTVLQTLALVLMILPLGSLGSWALWPGWILMAAVLVVTLVTGVDYLLKAMDLRRSYLLEQEK
ncbi:MAG: CDP-diacylglycerol--glycerol-3-phosphate 3-phosphatidyltransferase [Rothia sp. (in: high G+C Gram-positive bacteria)]|nr:CDP-diacylglycerol--glycerol-3-phosphate 3-phosphatidyltransferase [Rothia sp. (in: high G+C Gram-positive bacteria)]